MDFKTHSSYFEDEKKKRESEGEMLTANWKQAHNHKFLFLLNI